MRTRVVSSLLLAALCAGVPPWAPVRAETPPPNIMIILTDDQRPGTMSVMPKTRLWFEERGVRYPNAHVTTPLCCPSRASILTGRYAHNHGVETNSAATALDFGTTLPSYLRNAGYRTGYAGKFLNGWDKAPPFFDRWSTLATPSGNGYTGTTFNENGVIKAVDAYSTAHVRDRAVDFLHLWENVDARPWFLVVAPYAPHLPAVPAKRFQDHPVPPWKRTPAVAEADRTDKPPHVQESSVREETVARIHRKQLRTLLSVDTLVDRTMKVLGELGERQGTLAFYLSDNGFLLGEHGVKGKRYPYEASIKVPMLARWPGRLHPGTVDPRLAANIDIPATILEAAGITPAVSIDGRSLLAPAQRERLFLEYFLDPGWEATPTWRSILTPDLQYVEYLGADGEITFREYYDLGDDPWRLENLLADADPSNDPPAPEVAALGTQTEQYSACSGTGGPGACP